jgi:hypothetical protein
MTISKDLETCATSPIRAESLALEEYPQMERKPMVPSIARIVMTTISSTKVKPLYLLILGWVGEESL